MPLISVVFPRLALQRNFPTKRPPSESRLFLGFIRRFFHNSAFESGFFIQIWHICNSPLLHVTTDSKKVFEERFLDRDKKIPTKRYNIFVGACITEASRLI